MASPKKKTYDSVFADAYLGIQKQLVEELNKPSPLLDLFNDNHDVHLQAHKKAGAKFVTAYQKELDGLVDDMTTVPLKQMYGKIKLKKGDLHPQHPGVTWVGQDLPPNPPGKVTTTEIWGSTATGGQVWVCGCKNEPKSYGMTQFRCHKPGNHCYRERAGG